MRTASRYIDCAGPARGALGMVMSTVLLCSLTLGACTDAPAPEAAWQATLERSHTLLGTTSSSLGIWTPDMDAPWIGVAGVTDVAGMAAPRPLRPGDTFRVASITKVFVAVVIMQLAEQGALARDDPLSTWGGLGVPGAADITIEHLLSHSSGLVDYTDSPELDGHLGRPWSAQELLALATSRPPLFEPGQAYSYSNTNYLLLGMIIEEVAGEQVTGRTWADQVHRRILQPLGMTRTVIPGHGEPAHLVAGYQRIDGELVDVTHLIHPSVTGAAGALISNTGDLLRFGRALFHGELIDQLHLAEMMEPIWQARPYRDLPRRYGLGLMTMYGDSWTMLGHSGIMPGYEAWLGYLPEDDIIIVSMHSTTVGGMAEETVAWLDAHLARVIAGP